MQSKQASKWWWCDVSVRLLATGEGCSSFIHMQSLIRIAGIVFAINLIKCQIEARNTWRIESKSVLTHFTSCSRLWNEWQVRWVKTLLLSTHHTYENDISCSSVKCFDSWGRWYIDIGGHTWHTVWTFDELTVCNVQPHTWVRNAWDRLNYKHSNSKLWKHFIENSEWSPLIYALYIYYFHRIF